MPSGIELDARDLARTFFQHLAQYLAGGIDILGATLRGGPTLTIQARLDSGAVTLAISGPQPTLSKQLGPLAFSGTLKGARITSDAATLVIDGLPDVVIRLT